MLLVTLMDRMLCFVCAAIFRQLLQVYNINIMNDKGKEREKLKQIKSLSVEFNGSSDSSIYMVRYEKI
jgi:hypothetical protein